MGTLGIVGHVQLLAEFPALAVFHERHEARCLQGYDVSFLALFFCRLCIGVQGTFRQSGQLVGLQRQFVAVGFLQVVLREAQGQHAQFRRELAEAFLLFRIQVGPATDEPVISRLEQHPVFGIHRFKVGAVIHLLDAGKQSLVQGDVVAVFRQLRHHSFGNFLQLVAGFRTQQITENSGDLIQECARFLQCHDRIVKVGCGRIVDKGIDLPVVCLHALLHGRFEMRCLQQVERKCSVGRMVFRQEWVGFVGHGSMSLEEDSFR